MCQQCTNWVRGSETSTSLHIFLGGFDFPVPLRPCTLAQIQGRRIKINMNFLGRIRADIPAPCAWMPLCQEVSPHQRRHREHTLFGADVRDCRCRRPRPEGLPKNLVQKESCVCFVLALRPERPFTGVSEPFGPEIKKISKRVLKVLWVCKTIPQTTPEKAKKYPNQIPLVNPSVFALPLVGTPFNECHGESQSCSRCHEGSRTPSEESLTANVVSGAHRSVGCTAPLALRIS